MKRLRGHGLPLVLLIAALAADPLAAQSTRPQTARAAVGRAAVERRLLDATRRTPADPAAHRALAAFYIEEGRLDPAIVHLKRAHALDPGHYASGYDLAVALLQRNRLQEARAQVAAMRAAKETGELLNLLGDIEEQAGDLLAAAEAYQRAAHMDATEEHLFDWGNNLIQLRAFDPAADVFAAAIERHPGSARLFVGLGIARYSRGQYEDALRSFCQAADLAPSDWRAYQFLGEMYGVAPDPTGEIARRLARFVAAHPRHAGANLYYALSLWKGRQGPLPPSDARQVETLLRKAVGIDPSLTKGFLELGILLSEQGRYAEAIPPLQRAVALDAGLAQAHYRLAQAYQRTGQRELAAKELEMFRALGKDR